jgi:hypothetical protein
MPRYGPPLLAAGGVLLLVPVLFGGFVPVVLLLLLVPIGVGTLVATRGGRRRQTPDSGWGATAPRAAPTASGALPASDHEAASGFAVGTALGRVEAKQLLRSPWFGVGLGFLVLLAVLFGVVWADENDETSWRAWFVFMPIMAHPMVGMALLASFFATTRSRRDGLDELFESTPTTLSTRSLGHLFAGWVPAAAIGLFVVAISLLVNAFGDLYGPIDLRGGADVLTAIALGGCGAALGVALARWLPWAVVPVVALFLVLQLELALGNIGEPHWSNARQLSPWPRYPNHDLLFTDPPVWWHLLWIVSLGALMAVIALARGRGPGSARPLALAAGAAVVVAAVAGYAETRPLSPAAASHIASLVAEPQQHQACVEEGRAVVCTYRGYESMAEATLAEVAPVVAASPPQAGEVRLEQRFDGDVDMLGPEVAAALDQLPQPQREDEITVLGYPKAPAVFVGARIAAGLDAVGLPSTGSETEPSAVVAGQAPGVVALWLAAQDLPDDEAADLLRHHYNPDDHAGGNEPPEPDANDLGRAWPDVCLAGPAPVSWSQQDLEAARALAGEPDDQIRNLLIADWDRLTDPATTTDELLAAAGLDPVGPIDEVSEKLEVCDW